MKNKLIPNSKLTTLERIRLSMNQWRWTSAKVGRVKWNWPKLANYVEQEHSCFLCTRFYRIDLHEYNEYTSKYGLLCKCPLGKEVGNCENPDNPYYKWSYAEGRREQFYAKQIYLALRRIYERELKKQHSK